MWAIPTGASWILKKKKSGKESQLWSRVPKTGSDSSIGSDRESGCDKTLLQIIWLQLFPLAKDRMLTRCMNFQTFHVHTYFGSPSRSPNIIHAFHEISMG